MSKTEPYTPTPKLSRQEFKFISISIGNTNIRWALHDTRDDDLDAQYQWTTPHIQYTDLFQNSNDDTSDLSVVLVRFLPEDARMFIFGGGYMSNGRESQDRAVQQRESRGYDVSIYIVSSNPTQTEYVKKLVNCTPSKVHLMQPDDFFSVKEGRYAGMGIDRLASLRGAMVKCGVPAMVFDGGTAITYAAVNRKGHIIGGGITAGLQMRLDALSQNCESLPSLDIHLEAVEEFEKLRQNPSRKLSCFAKNTRDAIIHGMLCELHSSMKEIIRRWITQTKEGSLKVKKGKMGRKKRKGDDLCNDCFCVLFTGGSGELLEKLVRPGKELVEGSFVNMCDENFYYETMHVHDLIHLGVSWYIRSHGLSCPSKKKQDPMLTFQPEQYIKRRVVGLFPKYPDQIFRGTVMSYKICDEKKEPLYFIRYDDGDEEELYYHDVNATEGRDLKALLSFFDKYGEEEVDPETEPLSFINRRFVKRFKSNFHFATIVSYDDSMKYWKVVYDDGDCDENDKDELLEGLKLYNEHKPRDPKY